MIFFSSLLAATMFCTRWPVRWPTWAGPHDVALATGLGWFPLIGAALGGGASLLVALLMQAGWSAPVALVVALASHIAATGALHEDGLADTLDGLGGLEAQKRLAIMRDSRIGTYGIIGLGVILSLRGALFYDATLTSFYLLAQVWILAAATSRLAMLVVMNLGQAVGGGLAQQVATPSVIALALAMGTVAILSGLLLGPLFGISFGLFLLALAWAVGLLIVPALRRWIGGFTGDTLGATQQVAEVIILMILVRIL